VKALSFPLKKEKVAMYKENDTICAIATASGGALGVIRVSGPESIFVVDELFDKNLHKRSAGTFVFGHLMDGPEVLDEVLVNLFRGPHSYTGEDVVEISCHGSPYILQRAMELLVGKGTRLAEPGEFTQRAFFNGKMDLSQAEAVADLIASSSEASHRMAIRQMRGDFSKELKNLREKLLRLTSLLELELDFSDHEDLEFADRSELKQLCADIEKEISRLADSFRLGNALKKGIPVAIVGQSNAGKSTLLNAIVGEEKAIVSEIRGTTRDAVEDCVNLNGILFRFIDTAGIRATIDKVERLGIERTFAQIEKAEIVLWTFDATRFKTDFSELSSRILPLCKGKRLVLVLNKVDLKADVDVSRELIFCPKDTAVLPICAQKGRAGITPLLNWLSAHFCFSNVPFQGVIVSNVRHYEALDKARKALQRVAEGLASGLSGDLLSQDLRECLHHLTDIIGEVSTPDVLENIFKHFCIGK